MTNLFPLPSTPDAMTSLTSVATGMQTCLAAPDAGAPPPEWPFVVGSLLAFQPPPQPGLGGLFGDVSRYTNALRS